MGGQFSVEQKVMKSRQQSSGTDFPGSDFKPSDRKNWMAGFDLDKLTLNQIVWPGTHNSATNGIGIPLITRPFNECQHLSIYEQLVKGTRVLDIRVQEDRLVCHDSINSYNVDRVLDDVNKFLSETQSEIIILEIRTEIWHEDPPEFDKFLIEKLGDYLIHQDDDVFEKTVSELLPKRVICVWKPKGSVVSKTGDPLWGPEYLKDDWIDTDLPYTKFESNMYNLRVQQPAFARNFFYRVEHALSHQQGKLVSVRSLASAIQGYARLFIQQCFDRDVGDRLQIFSTDFIEPDFVDACVGLTHARIQGEA